MLEFQPIPSKPVFSLIPWFIDVAFWINSIDHYLTIHFMTIHILTNMFFFHKEFTKFNSFVDVFISIDLLLYILFLIFSFLSIMYLIVVLWAAFRSLFSSCVFFILLGDFGFSKVLKMLMHGIGCLSMKLTVIYRFVPRYGQCFLFQVSFLDVVPWI